MSLGLVGFGEASFELAKGLKSEEFGTIVAYDPLLTHATYGALVKERGKEANVELSESMEYVVNQSEVLIVAVPADMALEVSESLVPHLREGLIYVDVSASSPNVKKSIWQNIKLKGVSFVDAAMLGPLTVYQHKVPMQISGSGSELFVEYMKPYNMNIEIVSHQPGDASAVKLVRSIYMKGVAALFVESLEAARALNVDDLVIHSLKETMENGSFEKTMNQLVTGTSIHALRRSKELEGSIEMLESLNINSEMAKATREKLLFVSNLNLKEKFQGERPEDWKNVIDMIAATKG